MTKSLCYTVLVDGKPGTYGVVFPELGGCVAMGSTINEVLSNASEALRDWAEVTRRFGEHVPEPQPLGRLLRRKDIREWHATAEAIAIATVLLPPDPQVY